MTPSNPDKCPICGMNAQSPIQPADDFYRVNCELCGEYRISVELHQDLRSMIGDLSPYLSAATRQSREAGDRLSLTSDNWRGYAESHRYTPIRVKLDKLMRYFERRTQYPGEPVPVSDRSIFPLIGAQEPGEVRYFCEHARRIGYISGPIEGTFGPFAITIAGWEYLDPSSSGSGVPGRVFVAMSFDPDMKPVYEDGLEPALKIDCRLDPIRIDLVHHNEKICDRILAEIRRCQFVVADYTQHKHGVYFEDGFAQGMGRQVVRTCRGSDIQGAHFDTRQYNHVVWDSPGDLRVKLRERIQALGLVRKSA